MAFRGGATPLAAALTNPTMPALNAMQPDPSQVGLWQNFQNRLAQDPNLRMALMMTGLGMLRSPQPGQTGFDVFANAAQQGIGTFNALGEQQRTARLEERAADRGDRAVAVQEENVDVARDKILQSGEQFDTRMGLAEREFQESIRQFNEREAGLDQRNRENNTTASERILNRSINALVVAMPDVYPDTDEGRAKAMLRIQELNQGSDRIQQARVIAGLISDMQANNIFMPEDQQLTMPEIERRAISMFELISSDLSAGQGPAPGQADPLVGVQIDHPAHGPGRVTAGTEPGTYNVEFRGRVFPNVSAEVVRQLQGNTGGQ